MIFWVLTLFPEMLDCLQYSIVGRALQKGIIELRTVDYRDYAQDKHKCVDDSPYGGGTGMVLKVEPIARALRALPEVVGAQETQETKDVQEMREAERGRRVVLLSPQGKVFSQTDGLRLAAYDEVVFVCGRYEGFDERVRALVHEEISLGDYVVSGGELAAAVLIDAVARQINGVLGNEASLMAESYADGCLEYPQYTRPVVFEGMAVPEVLLSGHHAQIERWRRKESLRRTCLRRPELLKDMSLMPRDRELLEELAWEGLEFAERINHE